MKLAEALVIENEEHLSITRSQFKDSPILIYVPGIPIGHWFWPRLRALWGTFLGGHFSRAVFIEDCIFEYKEGAAIELIAPDLRNLSKKSLNPQNKKRAEKG